jgi:hypothetical protein
MTADSLIKVDEDMKKALSAKVSYPDVEKGLTLLKHGFRLATLTNS